MRGRFSLSGAGLETGFGNAGRIAVAAALLATLAPVSALAQDRVPQSPGVSFKPLLLNVSQGYYINVLRLLSSEGVV